MAAGINDFFTKATATTRPDPTTLVNAKSFGAASITVAALNGWPTDTAVHFVIYTTNAATGLKIAGSQTDWKGIVSGTTITNLVLKAGTDPVAGYPIGATVVATPTAAWENDIANGILTQHAQDGTHTAVTATSVASDSFVGKTASTTTTIAGLGITSGSVTTNNSIPANALATNAITLGYTQITSTVSGLTGTSGTPVQVTGMTSTVTIPAGGRRIEITVKGASMFASAAATVTLSIWDGAVGSGTLIGSSNNNVPSGSYEIMAFIQAIASPAAGSKTYNVGIGSSTGTQSFTAATTSPAYILVKAI